MATAVRFNDLDDARVRHAGVDALCRIDTTAQDRCRNAAELLPWKPPPKDIPLPANGTKSGKPINIAIEVKLAHNKDAAVDLKKKLIKRYMKELDTDFGLYVVAWMGSRSSAGLRSLWSDPRSAQACLTKIANDTSRGGVQSRDVRVVVLDLSLPRDSE